jgi:hypothetical protein
LKAVGEAKLEIDKNRPAVLRWISHIVVRERRRAIRARLSLPGFG